MTAHADLIIVAVPPGWAKQITKDLAAIKAALRIIEENEEHDMAELDDRLAEIAADEDVEHAQLARLIADFEASGTLTDAQRTALDAIKSHVVGDTTAITDADPEPAPPAVEPVPAEVPVTDATEVPAG